MLFNYVFSYKIIILLHSFPELLCRLSQLNFKLNDSFDHHVIDLLFLTLNGNQPNKYLEPVNFNIAKEDSQYVTNERHVFDLDITLINAGLKFLNGVFLWTFREQGLEGRFSCQDRLKFNLKLLLFGFRLNFLLLILISLGESLCEGLVWQLDGYLQLFRLESDLFIEDRKIVFGKLLNKMV